MLVGQEKKFLLINLLTSCINYLTCVLYVVYCSGHCFEGGNMDVIHVAKLFTMLMRLIDSNKEGNNFIIFMAHQINIMLRLS